ncbi:hypothetical protein SMNI109538_08050 [Smaragdicoccus niigatensis]
MSVLSGFAAGTHGYDQTMNLSDTFRPLEELAALDPVSDLIQRRWRKILDGRAAGTILRGEWLGHAAHPALVAVPIGAWTGAIVLDRSGEPRAARRMIGLGLASLPAVITTGWADWSTLDGRQRRVGLVHAATNAAGVALFLTSYLRRRTGADETSRWLGLLGWSAVGLGGAIGGHLVFNQGARVAQRPNTAEAVVEYNVA